MFTFLAASSAHRKQHRVLSLLLQIGAIILTFTPQHVHASITVQNETYPSLPGLFGRAMIQGKNYHAQLQFLRENPYLCQMYNATTPSSYVHPPRLPVQGNVSDIPQLERPVALLAARGECSFYHKAMTAQSIDSNVQFLIVYNTNADGEDALVPMFSEYGDTRLVLLSVSHLTGQTLKKYIATQSDLVRMQGGPIVEFNADPPEDFMTVEDLQQMLLSTLGLLFFLVSFSGCIIICAGIFGNVTGSRIVVTQHGTLSMERNMLTEEQVRQLSAEQTQVEGREPSCAVCIEDLNDSEPEQIITLPCHHRFHADCILPWLTERQAKCPLCKYDLLDHLQHHEEREASPSASVSMWDRLLRYRWTHVHAHQDESDNNESAISQQNDGSIPIEVELTEPRRIS